MCAQVCCTAWNASAQGWYSCSSACDALAAHCELLEKKEGNAAKLKKGDAGRCGKFVKLQKEGKLVKLKKEKGGGLVCEAWDETAGNVEKCVRLEKRV